MGEPSYLAVRVWIERSSETRREGRKSNLYLRAGISQFTTMFQLWTILSVGFC
jgi:hypothetical protein